MSRPRRFAACVDTVARAHSRRRGFTIVELAIVVVAAAGLAIVAIPVYNAFYADAQWMEAEELCSDVHVALRARLASGEISLAGREGMPLSDLAPELKIEVARFDGLRYFAKEDFTLDTAPAGALEAGQFRFIVTGSLPHSPPGTLTLDYEGTWTRIHADDLTAPRP